MRYSQAHAAKSGSVPFMLRGPKSVRTVLAAAVAGAIGFVPVILAASPAQATIAGYSLDASSKTAAEGSDLVFTITRASSQSALAAQTLTWTAEGSSVNGAAPAEPTTDFTPSGTVDFAADSTAPYSQQTGKVVIHTVNDTMDEYDESLTITITAPGGETVEATGLITDNDAAPTYKLMVDEANPDESAGTVNVSAKLDAPSGKTVTIPISTADLTGAGSAKAGQDYEALDQGTALTVLPGDTESDTEPITITDDVLYEEPKQSFTVKGATDVTVTGTQTASVGIVDNEDQPEISIGADLADEGDPLIFGVHLSGLSERAVTASYATADGSGSDVSASDAAAHGTATAGSDYTASTGTVTFPAVTSNDDPPPSEATAQEIRVRTTNDSIDETNPEDMHVTLTSPTIAKLSSDTVATGGIDSDDLPPNVSLLPSSRRITEGSTGRKAATFTVKLDRAAGRKVSVDYHTSSGTGPTGALEGQDFIKASGTLSFAPGETQKTFTVDIVGDTAYEGDETFNLSLDSSTATVPSSNPDLSDVAITIVEDDKVPTVSVAALSMKEGNEGSIALLPIKLSNPLGVASTYTVTAVEGNNANTAATHTGTDPGETDYLTPASEVTIPAGQSTGYVYFLVNGDDVYEADEQLTITVAPATPVDSNGDPVITGDPKSATVTLVNDDAAPSLEIVNATGEEGDSVQVTGVTNGVTQHDVPLTISFKGASVGGSVAATAADFTDPGSVTVPIPGGDYSGTTINVGAAIALTDDTTNEPAETIAVTGVGSGAGGVGTVKPGVLTIAPSDGGTATTPPPVSSAPTIMVPATINGAIPVSVTGKAAAGATVELWAAPMSAANAPLAKILETKASAAGTYSFSRWIGSGYTFQVKVGTLTSEKKMVRVQQVPVFVASSPSAGTVSLAVQGNPRGVGQTVIIQRWVNGAWVNTTWRGSTGSDNLWKATAKQPSKSVWTLRAFVAGDTAMGILPGYTLGTTLTVK